MGLLFGNTSNNDFSVGNAPALSHSATQTFHSEPNADILAPPPLFGPNAFQPETLENINSSQVDTPPTGPSVSNRNMETQTTAPTPSQSGKTQANQKPKQSESDENPAESKSSFKNFRAEMRQKRKEKREEMKTQREESRHQRKQMRDELRQETKNRSTERKPPAIDDVPAQTQKVSSHHRPTHGRSGR